LPQPDVLSQAILQLLYSFPLTAQGRANASLRPWLALPYWQFLPWVAANGLNLRLYFLFLYLRELALAPASSPQRPAPTAS
jgi:hypothetical protein